MLKSRYVTLNYSKTRILGHIFTECRICFCNLAVDWRFRRSFNYDWYDIWDKVFKNEISKAVFHKSVFLEYFVPYLVPYFAPYTAWQKYKLQYFILLYKFTAHSLYCLQNPEGNRKFYGQATKLTSFPRILWAWGVLLTLLYNWGGVAI